MLKRNTPLLTTSTPLNELDVAFRHSVPFPALVSPPLPENAIATVPVSPAFTTVTTLGSPVIDSVPSLFASAIT